MSESGGIGEERHVIPSVLEREAEAAERALAQARRDCALIELRADHLRADDLAGLVRRAGPGVLVAVRRAADGGEFTGAEEERGRLLRAALEAGARYVDVERAAPPLEPGERREAAERLILSDHGAACEPAELARLYAEMAASPAAVIKIVPRAESPAQAPAVYDLLRRAARDGRRLVCFAMGRGGGLTRLLAPSWGSWATYGSLHRGAETGEGQFPAADLLEVHRVLGIGKSTRRFGLLGSRVFGSPSPAMHNSAYAALGLDARYLPVELDDLESIEPLLGRPDAFGFEALAVTMPLKERAAARCRELDPAAREAGAVNTVILGREGWEGFNTDGPAAAALIRERLVPQGARVAVVGAGGTARAVAAALRGEGADVTLFNRTEERAEAAGARLGVPALPLELLGGWAWDILVNATPLGTAGERVLPAERLSGRLVLDAVYRVPPTPLVADAERRGLAAIDGLALLARQAELQFRRMTGRQADGAAMAAAAMQWLEDRVA